MADLDDEVLQMYIEESREHLADIEADLLTIEEGGADANEELVNKVFRAAHSLKGGAGFFGLVKIKELAHKIENVLDMVRSHKLIPSPDVVNILLLSFDRLRELINNTSESNDADISEFIVSLTGLACANLPSEQKEAVQKMVEVKLPEGRTIMSVSKFDVDRAQEEKRTVYFVECDLIHDVHRMGKTPLDLIRQVSSAGTILDCIIDVGSVGTLDEEPSNKIPFFLVCASEKTAAELSSSTDIPENAIKLLFPADRITATHDEPPQAAKATPAPAPDMPRASQTAPAPAVVTPQVPAQANQPETSLRVNVALLESLMNLASELVLSRNQLLEAITQNDQRTLKASGQRISMVTSELQETIMLTRMQPIGNVFNKFQRVVRDMAKSLDKQVRLDIFGSDVEMDKTIIEGLSDPLTHLVRNAVDHGIETPEQRTKAGKSLPGVITLRAYHEAGQVNVEIKDDGKGIDPRTIANSASAKGLISMEQVKTMSEKEMISLILLPGLSTAEKVTDVSGRGVGMDVVKTNLDKLGGQVDITSEVGDGSTFRIKLPLTLAIIPCLLVSVNKERFAIPQVNVEELIRIPASKVRERIELVGNAEVLVLRGKLIPIVHLGQIFGVSRTFMDPEDGLRKQDQRERFTDRRFSPGRLADGGAFQKRLNGDGRVEEPDRRELVDRRYHAASDLNVVVVTTGTFEYGLVVEELHDSVEIVVKPLGRHIKHLQEYLGATIMGDGKVALILDVAGLAQMNELTSLSGSSRATEVALEAERNKADDMHALLTFWNGPREQCAVPLDLVARVEQISPSDIEMVTGKRVMQYRGRIMPLFTLRDVADVESIEGEEDLAVIVFQIGEREMGLLARTPVDVVEAKLNIDQSTVHQTGIMGTTVLAGQTVLVINIFELVDTRFPEWLKGKQRTLSIVGNDDSAVLLAEDSTFFREQVRKFIEEEGYRVIAAEDGSVAWSSLEENAGRVKLVVTDIEMPNLDGYGLTKKIKGDSRFSHLPVIALTSLASEDDLERGKAAGVDEYQIKLDREKLLEGIGRLLQPGAQ